MQYPATKRDDIVDVIHGTRVPDPYRWLEDAGRDDVKAWMTEQDQHTRDYLAALPDREKLVTRLKALLHVDSVSPPVHYGGRYFYGRRHKDREKGILYWRQGESGQERVLLDPNLLSADGSVALGSWRPSWDGQRIVYGLHPNNGDEETLHVMEVATGKVSDVDVIPNMRWSGPTWSAAGDGFYYTWVAPISPSLPASEQPGTRELRFHRLGSDPKGDVVLHGPTRDPQRVLGGWATRSGHWLFTQIQNGWSETALYFRDLRQPDSAWQPLVQGRPNLYSVEEYGDQLYLLTNEEAPRFRLFKVDPRHPARADWREIVAQSPDIVIESATVIGRQLALTTLHHATSGLSIYTLDGQKVRDVALPGLGSSSGLMGQDDEDDAYFAFVSFTTPLEVYKTSVASGAVQPWSKVEVPIDPTPFTVEQVWYPSKDGTKISMFIVRRKDLPRDG